MKARSHYRAGDVARLLGVSQRTIGNWFERGVLPGYRLPSGSRQYRVPHGELLRYLRAHAPLCTPEALRLIAAEDVDVEDLVSRYRDLEAEIERLKAERDALCAALRGLLPLCGCDEGQRARRSYDAASGQMELDGFERCPQCAKARELLAGSEGGL